jgi:HlyD family secretion protein
MPDTYREPMNDSSQSQAPTADINQLLGQGGAKQSLMRRKWPWLAAGAAVLVIVAIVLRPSAPEAPRFTLGDVTQGGLTVTVTATGNLQPLNQVEVGPEISGQIEDVLVDFNDRVTKDQVLASMDTDNLNAKVLQARASVASAKAKSEEARATASEARTKAARVRELFGRGNASKQEFDAAEAAENRSKASVASAEAQIAVSEANLAADETNLSKAAI